MVSCLLCAACCLLPTAHATCTAYRHEGTGGATDPEFPVGFVQIGPYTSGGPGPSSDASFKAFLIRMGQTNGYGFAPNPVWPNTFMATAFDLANPPGTKCLAGCIHIFNKQVFLPVVGACSTAAFGTRYQLHATPLAGRRSPFGSGCSPHRVRGNQPSVFRPKNCRCDL